MATDTGGVGGFVRNRRLALGMTQDDLAEATQLSQKRISQIEAHREAGYLPPLDNIRALSRALGCKSADLLRSAGYLDVDEVPIDLNDPLLNFMTAHTGELTDDEKRVVIDVIRTILKRG